MANMRNLSALRGKMAASEEIAARVINPALKSASSVNNSSRAETRSGKRLNVVQRAQSSARISGNEASNDASPVAAMKKWRQSRALNVAVSGASPHRPRIEAGALQNARGRAENQRIAPGNRRARKSSLRVYAAAAFTLLTF